MGFRIASNDFNLQDSLERCKSSAQSFFNLSTREIMSANASVLKKLGLYSLALFTLPLLMYVICDSFIAAALLGHNSKYHIVFCGGAAAMTVNIVLGMYVWMAINEDQGYGRGELKKAQ